MARLAIFSHAPSDSVNALKAAMAEQGVELVKIRRTASTFRGRAGDLIINYGSSDIALDVMGRATVINHPTVIAGASNKANSFRKFQEAGVKTVEWTTDGEQAQVWLDNGDMVYARKRLQGHSGEGIEISFSNPAGVGDAGDVPVSSTLPSAPLYTKAILSERREFRIHVMKGVITYVQQKRRRDGYRDEPSYSNLVRNHHTGWIYATQNAEVCEEAKREAIKAINALGLDYGAVDVITRRGEAWVLEVNTAPGMSGTNLETYTENFLRVYNGEAPVGATVDLTALQEEIQDATNNTPVAAAPEPAPQAQRSVAPAPAQARPAPVPAAPVSAPESTALTNQGFYKLTVNGERTVGQYDADMEHFMIIGWEVPVELADAEVHGVLNVL